MSTDRSPGRFRRGPPLVRCVGLLLNGKDKPVTASSSDLEQVTEKGIRTTHNPTHEDELASTVGSPARLHQDSQVARCVGVVMKGNNYRIKSTNPENEPGIDIGVEYVSWSSSEEDDCEENHKQLNKFEFQDGERMEFTVSSGQFLEAIKRMKKNKGYAVIIVTKKPQDGFQWVPGSEIELDWWTINKDIDDVSDDSSDDSSDYSDDSSDYSDIVPYTDAERIEIAERSRMQLIAKEFEAIERERCELQRWIDDMGLEEVDEDEDLLSGMKFD